MTDSRRFIELDHDGLKESPADHGLLGKLDQMLKPRKPSHAIGAVILATLALSSALSLNARAQQAPPTQCWEIVSPNSKDVPSGPILINKCTGKSWFLAKVAAPEAKADAPGTYVLRWRPITMDDTGEVTFTMPLR